MINIMFREGNRHVIPARELQPELLKKLKDVTDSNVWRLNCPIHKSHSRATLLIDVSLGSIEWDIVDFCCEEFCREITTGMTQPWNHPPSINRLGRAT